MLFYSFFKSIVGVGNVVVELKDDLSICGTLHSVDQYLNIKLTDVTVTDPDKYPHMVKHLPGMLYADSPVPLMVCLTGWGCKTSNRQDSREYLLGMLKLKLGITVLNSEYVEVLEYLNYRLKRKLQIEKRSPREMENHLLCHYEQEVKKLEECAT